MEESIQTTNPNQISNDEQNRLIYGNFDLPDRNLIVGLIKNWNETRMDMFEIKQPEPNSIEFYGVIRFYHQDSQQRVSTKCIRVASSATTQDVIETLAQKFRPDMKMLTSNYGLYEVHQSVNGTTRKLNPNERPIIIQLLWTQDMKEGRLTLRNEDDPVSISLTGTGKNNANRLDSGMNEFSDDSEDSNNHNLRGQKMNGIPPGNHNQNQNHSKNNNNNSNSNSSNLQSSQAHSGSTSTLTKLTRKLTARKKQQNKNNKLAAELRRASMKTGHTPFNIESAVAHQVYKEKPETNFTRTISNPEAVLKRQRDQKVQQRLLKQSRNIKIYGQNLGKNCPPFITLQVNSALTCTKVLGQCIEHFKLNSPGPTSEPEPIENFELYRLELSSSFDENNLSLPKEEFDRKFGNSKKIVKEEHVKFHHRPHLLLTEFEKFVRLRNLNLLCAFQLRRVSGNWFLSGGIMLFRHFLIFSQSK